MGVRALAKVLGTAVGGLGLVVAVAGPAAAKGPTGVTIGYPGGGPPVDLGGDGPSSQIGPLTEQLGLWSALGDIEVAPLAAEPPSEPVGEPYTVRWTMYHGGTVDGALVITQRLYLDPDGGGLVYTEAGQDAGPYAEDGTRGGWFQAPASLSRTLTAAGFDPAAPPPAGPAAAAGDEAAPDQGSGRPWLAPVGLAAAAAVGASAVGAAGVAVRRGRRERDAAPAAG
ncbi:MAG TPA: hypothetical protein VH479_15645 [Acidimicrobiales bacterium]